MPLSYGLVPHLSKKLSKFPLPDIRASPAELLFGRHLYDHLLNLVKFRREWLELIDLHEKDVKQCFTNTTKHVHLNPFKLWLFRTNMDITRSIRITDKQYPVLVDGSQRTTLPSQDKRRYPQHKSRQYSSKLE